MAGPKKRKASRELITWIALQRAEFNAHVAKMRSALTQQISAKRRELRTKREACAEHVPVRGIVLRAPVAAHRVTAPKHKKAAKTMSRSPKKAAKRRKKKRQAA